MSWLRKNIRAWIKKHGLFILGLFVTPLGAVMLIVFLGSSSNPGDKGLILLSLAVGVIGILAMIQGLSILDREK